MLCVSAQRLDLYELAPGEEVRIVAGMGNIRIHSNHADVTVNTPPRGSGPMWLAEGDKKDRWLNLAALHPLRVYWLTALQGKDGDGNTPRIHFRDVTPSIPERMAATIPTQTNRRRPLRIPRQRS